MRLWPSVYFVQRGVVRCAAAAWRWCTRDQYRLWADQKYYDYPGGRLKTPEDSGWSLLTAENITANSPRTTCTFLVGKFWSVRELKERLGFGVCSYMPLGVVWLEEQRGDNIFFWISTVFSLAALENWKSNWKWEQEITFAVRSPCV